MLSRVHAFRPASVVGRLPPRSDACPLSLRDLLSAAPGLCFPSIEAGSPEVAGAVLLAAKVLRATVGLALPRGQSPGPWFDAVVRTADDVAAALPFFLSGEVLLEGADGAAVERALNECWRLVGAGLTHLSFDAIRLPLAERARAVAEAAAPALESGIAVDCVLPVSGEGGVRAAAALVEELRGLRLPLDLVSVRCPSPLDGAAAKTQVAALVRLGEALGGVPVLRRGPVSPALLAAAASSSLRGCEDGGEVARAGGSEARAFAEASEIIETLGAAQGAPQVVRGLLQEPAEGEA